VARRRSNPRGRWEAADFSWRSLTMQEYNHARELETDRARQGNSFMLRPPGNRPARGGAITLGWILDARFNGFTKPATVSDDIAPEWPPPETRTLHRDHSPHIPRYNGLPTQKTLICVRVVLSRRSKDNLRVSLAAAPFDQKWPRRRESASPLRARWL